MRWAPIPSATKIEPSGAEATPKGSERGGAATVETTASHPGARGRSSSAVVQSQIPAARAARVATAATPHRTRRTCRQPAAGNRGLLAGGGSLEGRGESPQPLGVTSGRGRGGAFEFTGERGELRAVLPLQCRFHGADAIGGEPLRPRELVEIGAGDEIRGGPRDLRLLLRVEFVEPHGPGGVQLVLCQMRARLQLENVDAARHLGAVDVAVVPVCRPVAGDDQVFGVHRTTIEVSDLERFARVSEVEHRNAALIPALHHDVAAGDRHEGAIVGHTIFELRLRCRQFVVAAELQLAVDDIEDRIRAPLRKIGRPAANAIFDVVDRKLQFRSYYKLDRKSTRLNSSHLVISYAVFC